MRSSKKKSGGEPERRTRRLQQAAIGAAGLAVLGAGTILLTSCGEENDPSAERYVAAPPRSAPSDAQPSSSPAGTPPSPSRTPADSGFAGPSVPPDPTALASAVRSAAAKVQVEAKYPPFQQPVPAPLPQATTKNAVEKNGSFRVVTARGDLSRGQELSWVAGGITEHGSAKCSQTFQFRAGQKPGKRENMLVCWRTSAQRSVVTVAVDYGGDPPLKKSLTTIKNRWNE